jgi:hypothetical protein
MNLKNEIHIYCKEFLIEMRVHVVENVYFLFHIIVCLAISVVLISSKYELNHNFYHIFITYVSESNLKQLL